MHCSLYSGSYRPQAWRTIYLALTACTHSVSCPCTASCTTLQMGHMTRYPRACPRRGFISDSVRNIRRQLFYLCLVILLDGPHVVDFLPSDEVDSNTFSPEPAAATDAMQVAFNLARQVIIDNK